MLYSTDGWIDSLRVSPDGRHLALLSHPLPGDSAGDVIVVDRDGHTRAVARNLVSATAVCWSRNGRELWWSGVERGSGAVISAWSPSGQTRTIFQSGKGDDILDLAPSGAALVGRADARRQTELVTGAASGVRDMTWFDWTFPAALSPDGRRLLFTEEGAGARGNGYTAYLRGTDGTPATELGSGEAWSLSPDGRFAAVINPLDSGHDWLTLLPTGVGEPRQIHTPGVAISQVKWFPDGQHLLLTALDTKHGTFFEENLAGGAPRPVPSPKARSTCFSIAPGGKEIAAVGLDGSLMVVPVPGGSARTLPHAGPGAPCVLSWTADGAGIFYQDATPIPARIHRLTVASGRDEIVREVGPTDLSGVQAVEPLLITPDGKTIVYSYRRILSFLLLVRGLD